MANAKYFYQHRLSSLSSDVCYELNTRRAYNYNTYHISLPTYSQRPMVSLNRNTKGWTSIPTSNHVSLLKKLQQLVCQVETLVLAVST